MITLANDHVKLTLHPDFGARVTSLTDCASGRQWLINGDCVGGDSYLGDQARGWDECFPTVGACSHPAWGGAMRDHGLLWGRPWRVSFTADTCLACYNDPRFTFVRDLHLRGATVTADYRVTNHANTALPYLYSQHALLAVTPADKISLHGVTALHAGGQPFDWPHHPARDLSVIGPADAGFALKSYGGTPGAACAQVSGPDGGIRFDWAGANLPAFGLWTNYGGWPADNPVHQIALEPAAAPADDLATAAAKGCARSLAPGESHAWAVHITLMPPAHLSHP